MSTESHSTFLSADTELVRVHFSVNNISFQKEYTPHRGFITKFWGAVNNAVGVEEKNVQGERAKFEVLILADEKREAIIRETTDPVAGLVILMNNIFSHSY